MIAVLIRPPIVQPTPPTGLSGDKGAKTGPLSRGVTRARLVRGSGVLELRKSSARTLDALLTIKPGFVWTSLSYHCVWTPPGGRGCHTDNCNSSILVIWLMKIFVFITNSNACLYCACARACVCVFHHLFIHHHEKDVSLVTNSQKYLSSYTYIWELIHICLFVNVEMRFGKLFSCNMNSKLSYVKLIFIKTIQFNRYVCLGLVWL